MKNKLFYFEELKAGYLFDFSEHTPTPAEFDTLTEQARALFNRLNITARHGEKRFGNSAFISSTGSMHGFFFPSDDLRERVTGRRLLCVAFKAVYKFSFKPFIKTLSGFIPVAVFEDENENYFILREAEHDATPLEAWQKEIKCAIEEYENRVLAWEQVKRDYKKDGGTFAKMQNNFVNCLIEPYGAHYKASVFYSVGYRRERDTLCNSDNYPLTNADEITATINKYIEQLKKWTDEKRADLDSSAKIYAEIFQPLQAVILKYATPSNADGVKIDFLKHKVAEMVQALKIK
jgi:hypothetical protein